MLIKVRCISYRTATFRRTEYYDDYASIVHERFSFCNRANNNNNDNNSNDNKYLLFGKQIMFAGNDNTIAFEQRGLQKGSAQCYVNVEK